VAKHLREGVGLTLVVTALVLLGLGIRHLRDQEYVGAVLLVTTGLALIRSGVELLRPSMGE
jgi:hypothetical protein